MERIQWLEKRRNSIGGSNAPAIMGLNEYSSPYMVWADKNGLIPPKEDNEVMRIGRDLEDYVAKRWMEATGKKCRKKAGFIPAKIPPSSRSAEMRKVFGLHLHIGRAAFKTQISRRSPSVFPRIAIAGRGKRL